MPLHLLIFSPVFLHSFSFPPSLLPPPPCFVSRRPVNEQVTPDTVCVGCQLPVSSMDRYWCNMCGCIGHSNCCQTKLYLQVRQCDACTVHPCVYLFMINMVLSSVNCSDAVTIAAISNVCLLITTPFFSTFSPTFPLLSCSGVWVRSVCATHALTPCAPSPTSVSPRHARRTRVQVPGVLAGRAPAKEEQGVPEVARMTTS